ncbi:hypothetical protein ACFQZJ_02885 [Maribacter chungangensis]|uniref:Uncharacterized protein n=1 Tax=Maribacter chungangensis TaxID=1069117 RepID=A0ABW3AZ96_9FLAO
MKSTVILFVAVTMLLKPLWPIVDYIVNYDYIVNVLCENKDEPELNCDGKCYLTQMLAQETGQNDENPFSERQAKSEIQHVVFVEALLNHHFLSINSLQRQDNFNTAPKFVIRLCGSDIAHPPEVS